MRGARVCREIGLTQRRAGHIPDVLYALVVALDEPAAAVDQLLPPAGREHERYPCESAGYADGTAQGLGKPHSHAGDDIPTHNTSKAPTAAVERSFKTWGSLWVGPHSERAAQGITSANGQVANPLFTRVRGETVQKLS